MTATLTISDAQAFAKYNPNGLTGRFSSAALDYFSLADFPLSTTCDSCSIESTVGDKHLRVSEDSNEL